MPVIGGVAGLIGGAMSLAGGVLRAGSDSCWNRIRCCQVVIMGAAGGLMGG